MGNVLVFAPLALYSPHFETEIELGLKEREAGNELIWVSCPGGISHICHERFRNAFSCIGCKDRQKEGLSLLPKMKQFEFELSKEKIDLPDFKSIGEISSYVYRGVDVGSTVMSTYISIYREPNLNFEKYKDLLSRACEDVVRFTEGLFSLVESTHIDRAYVFNGRMALFRPMLRVLQLKGIELYVHERSGSVDRYSLCKNTFPHDLEYKKREILDLTSLMSTSAIVEKGEAWFKARRKGLVQGWPSFITEQIRGHLPESLSKEVKVISIFVSSEDEFESVSDWKNLIYQNQNQGISKIIEALPSDYIVIIRIHPNLKGVDNSQTRGLMSFIGRKNVVVVKADEPIDSYALMESSYKVITFGSTVGVESTYWGCVSISAGGRSLYEHLDACYMATSHEEVMSLIRSDLKPKSRNNALLYAAWENTYGIPFEYFKPDGFFGGEILGKCLSVSFFHRLLMKSKLGIRKLNE